MGLCEMKERTLYIHLLKINYCSEKKQSIINEINVIKKL